ncbi:PEP-CTERM sorting domain-containing protein [Alginatibacterium sediminis]|uniref:PEP-CTERM sorting domain-containing protein n=1 Tax=Alginatibacterium sediminis TaxID=2164068 RepID=A0A420E7C3_9ALTE|nr:THxN family PEP-CTERM protein [Alginatibacterium sediminis]RKF14374.1 PEP-CTERM sorting domain-containing protein [Alginatibacterium sediminis]
MKVFAKTCLVAAIGLVSTSASAIKITEWGYINEAGFYNYVDSAGNTSGITASGDSAGGNTSILPGGSLDTELAWGIPTNPNNGNPIVGPQSALLIDSPQSSAASGSNVVTDSGDWTVGTAMLHENFPISGDSLSTTQLIDGLSLQPQAFDFEGTSVALPVLPFGSAPTLNFNILFKETNNNLVNNYVNGVRSGKTPDGNPCEYTGLTNGEGVNVNGCADIFLFTGADQAGEELDFIVTDDGIEFSTTFMLPDFNDMGFDEYEYTATTRLSGLSLTLFDDCAGLTDGVDCVGFLTPENGISTLFADFQITARRVSEPATIAIFGLTLLGLASRRRRA